MYRHMNGVEKSYGRILRRHGVVKRVIEGKIGEEGSGGRERICTQLLDTLKEIEDNGI
jgi:hypothetical protein